MKKLHSLRRNMFELPENHQLVDSTDRHTVNLFEHALNETQTQEH